LSDDLASAQAELPFHIRLPGAIPAGFELQTATATSAEPGRTTLSVFFVRSPGDARSPTIHVVESDGAIGVPGDARNARVIQLEHTPATAFEEALSVGRQVSVLFHDDDLYFKVTLFGVESADDVAVQIAETLVGGR
jgi:hypothetical protein